MNGLFLVRSPAARHQNGREENGLIFFVALGLLCIMISFLLLGSYIRLLKKGRCVIGEICGIDNGTSYGQGGTAHFIEVQFIEDGQDIKLVWKEFLLCVFLLSLGILLILAGIYGWY